MTETAYLAPAPTGSRLDHAYGDRVHILSDAVSLSLLARLCHPDSRAPDLHQLLASCTRRLVDAALEQFDTREAHVPTRMRERTEDGVFVGRIFDPDQRVVVADLARGGMLPSHFAHMHLVQILDPEAVRVDHLYLQRVADPETGRVSGLEWAGSKIGGPVHEATLLVPDPMAATGTSICGALELYHRHPEGPPKRIVLCHLMVTPEYLRKVLGAFPDVHIYALRVDRGRSPADVLQARPGERWDEESGLDATDYIVPGAGGIGELLNNAFV